MTSLISENEIWKDIPNYEGLYQASNFGRIRTCDGKTSLSTKNVLRHWEQKVLSPKMDYKTNCMRVILYKDKKPKTHLVHRLIASTFLGESNLTVNHIDGNRFNNKLENLEWCSIKENINKGMEIGLYSGLKKVIIYNKKTGEKKEFPSLTKAEEWIGKARGYISNRITKNSFENNEFKWEVKEKVKNVEDLLSAIKEEREKTLTDYNRFIQNQNAYRDDLLVCKGKLMAYLDLECYLKTHKEEYKC